MSDLEKRVKKLEDSMSVLTKVTKELVKSQREMSSDIRTLTKAFSSISTGRKRRKNHEKDQSRQQKKGGVSPSLG